MKDRFTATVDPKAKEDAQKTADAHYRGNLSHYIEDLIFKDSERRKRSKKEQAR